MIEKFENLYSTIFEVSPHEPAVSFFLNHAFLQYAAIRWKKKHEVLGILLPAPCSTVLLFSSWKFASGSIIHYSSRWYCEIQKIQYGDLKIVAFLWKFTVFRGKAAYTVELFWFLVIYKFKDSQTTFTAMTRRIRP